MKRVKLLELGMKGTNFDFKIPAGTEVSNLNQAIALYIIETAKYRQIKPATALAEIQQWVQQLEDNL
jgi:hypothetical protein